MKWEQVVVEVILRSSCDSGVAVVQSVKSLEVEKESVHVECFVGLV